MHPRPFSNLKSRISKRTRPICIAPALLVLVTAQIATAADGQLLLSAVDKATGEPIACRIHLQNTNGRPVRIPGAVALADHVDFAGKLLLKLPVGNYTFVMERGLEYLDMTGHFRIDHFADDSKQVELRRFCNMAKEGWWSGDLDVQRSDKDLPLLMQAEDLHVATVTTFSNSKSEWTNRALPPNPLVSADGNRRYHLLAGEDSLPGGVLGYVNLSKPIDLKALASDSPLDHVVDARRQDNAWIDARSASAWDLPVWLGLGKLDSIEVVDRQFVRDPANAAAAPAMAGDRPRDKQLYPPPLGIGRWSQKVYFNVLNCGLRIPPTAGSGSGVTTNPLGYNRLYVYCGEQFSYELWWAGLRAGKVVITNGPMLRPTVEGEPPGHVFKAAAGEKVDLEIGLTLSTRDKISYLEIIQDGRVIHEVRLADWQQAGGKLPHVVFDKSGWFLVRAVADTPKSYRFAMTAPYYVEIGNEPRISRGSAQFFLDWLNEREAQVKITDAALRGATLAELAKARDYWKALLGQANAE